MPDITSLLREWARLHEAERAVAIERHAVEVQIRDAMDANRAEYAADGDVEVTYKETVEYLSEVDGPLRVIAEHLSPEDLDALLTTPKPPPPRKFHMQRVKALAKRGEPFLTAIEKATLRGPAQVKIRRVKP